MPAAYVGRAPTPEEIEAAIAAGQEAPEALVLMEFVPLFPLAMIGGVLIQLVIDRSGWSRHVSRPLMARISGTALDFTIVAALATLSLQAIGEHLVPVLLLSLVGIGWCVLAMLVIAPRVIPYNWFERGVGDFGQSISGRWSDGSALGASYSGEGGTTVACWGTIKTGESK